jgi:hypothetical protein
MLQPTKATRIDVGLILKRTPVSDRLEDAQKFNALLPTAFESPVSQTLMPTSDAGLPPGTKPPADHAGDRTGSSGPEGDVGHAEEKGLFLRNVRRYEPRVDPGQGLQRASRDEVLLASRFDHSSQRGFDAHVVHLRRIPWRSADSLSRVLPERFRGCSLPDFVVPAPYAGSHAVDRVTTWQPRRVFEWSSSTTS